MNRAENGKKENRKERPGKGRSFVHGVYSVMKKPANGESTRAGCGAGFEPAAF